MTDKNPLISIFNAGIRAVSGKNSVAQALLNTGDFKPDLVIAIGKAASDMYLGARERYAANTPAIVATKYGHTDTALLEYPLVTIIESGHPIPDKNSLVAGNLVLEAIRSLSADSQLLLLVSGGASAIAECLPADITLEDWKKLNRQLVSSSLDIAEINRQRKSNSLIKDGRLLETFLGRRVVVYAISDVEGDSISTIGSGIGDVKRTAAHHDVLIVASNQVARDAAANQAEKLGFSVKHNRETLYDDVYKLASELGSFLRCTEKGVYIWGGEPTIKLPETPGKGGRNQSLGLALAREISGLDNIRILVAGTDGTDGPTDAAGALVDGSTFRHSKEAQAALGAANAGDYLGKMESRFVTGPTGTNVMDLVIAIVE